ncbi:MAG: type 1 periplasmic binding fold superfamily protein [Flavobacteriaceae bacterium]|nr:type 1 periplasmic binding fold superfamily protein [Flavobacteriaceae bacterium]
MKSNFKYLLVGLLSVVIISCSKDDDSPEPINEEEVITTMTVVLNPGNITLKSQDLDGDGPNAPNVTVSGSLSANTTYTGSVTFLNELESPAEDITEEVEEEDDKHQVIFVSSGVALSVSDLNTDGNGNDLGTQFSLSTAAAGSGTLRIVLRHEPTKPNDGTLAGAGGETDIDVSFNVTVE